MEKILEFVQQLLDMLREFKASEIINMIKEFLSGKPEQAE